MQVNNIRCFAAVTFVAFIALAPANSVVAETISYYQYGQVRSAPPGPASLNLDITPFDPELGTLNSVTMTAEVNVSGSAQLWSSDEYAELSVKFSNSLSAVPELAWLPTVATFTDSAPLWYYDYDYEEGYVQLSGSGNKYAGPTTITSNFGQFLGANPFSLGLSLSALVSSTGNSGDTRAFSYDGDARLSYEYNYTPSEVPEPSALTLLGIGSIGLLAYAWRCRRS
jgi:hypothetical protein